VRFNGGGGGGDGDGDDDDDDDDTHMNAKRTRRRADGRRTSDDGQFCCTLFVVVNSRASAQMPIRKVSIAMYASLFLFFYFCLGISSMNESFRSHQFGTCLRFAVRHRVVVIVAVVIPAKQNLARDTPACGLDRKG